MSIQNDYEKDYIKNGVFNECRENGEWDQTLIIINREYENMVTVQPIEAPTGKIFKRKLTKEDKKYIKQNIGRWRY